VSEYGTHWNFFFTLALVAAAAAVATPASARATALCAAALLLLHQAALLYGIAQWVEHTPRRGLLSANKVGRAPAPGSLARARARVISDRAALGCAWPAGGASLPTRLPRHLVAGRRHRRGLAPARRCSQLVARPGGTRPADTSVGRRRSAHGSPRARLAPRSPRPAHPSPRARLAPRSPRPALASPRARLAPRSPRPALASPRARLAPRSPRPAAHACRVWRRGWRLTPGLAAFAAWCAQRHSSPMRRCSGRRDGCATWPTRCGSSRRRAGARAQLHAREPSGCACSPQTLLVLCICLGTSLVCPGPAPDLLDALNRHLLGVFLLANLLTGAVNLTLPTMHASGPFGLCVLCVYMVAVCAAACAAEGSKEKAVHGLR